MHTSNLNTPDWEIHTLWVYGELGPIEILCLRSWVRLGYKVILHSYHHPKVPEGVELFNAEQIVPENQIFYVRRMKSLAVFADLYRATIMKHFHALWLDADIFLVRKFNLERRNVLACEEFPSLEGINNAVMKLEPNHPIVDEIIARFRNPLRGVPWKTPLKTWPFIRRSLLTRCIHARNLSWGALGRFAIRDVIQKNGFDGQILPPEYCLTGSRVRLFDTIHESEKYILQPITYIHFYKSQICIDLNSPPPGSIYEHLWELVGK